jgi:hypothetical protein
MLHMSVDHVEPMNKVIENLFQELEATLCRQTRSRGPQITLPKF